MRNLIIEARFYNLLNQGEVAIVYHGDGFDGRISLYINEFLP